jgi:hypothetical protein
MGKLDSIAQVIQQGQPPFSVHLVTPDINPMFQWRLQGQVITISRRQKSKQLVMKEKKKTASETRHLCFN